MTDFKQMAIDNARAQAADIIAEPNPFRLKIKPEHYAYLRDAITPLAGKLRVRRVALEEKAALPKPLFTGEIERRLRWDATYAAKLTPWICDNLYPYLTDEHIDSALRSILAKMDV